VSDHVTLLATMSRSQTPTPVAESTRDKCSSARRSSPDAPLRSRRSRRRCGAYLSGCCIGALSPEDRVFNVNAMLADFVAGDPRIGLSRGKRAPKLGFHAPRRNDGEKSSSRNLGVSFGGCRRVALAQRQLHDDGIEPAAEP